MAKPRTFNTSESGFESPGGHMEYRKDVFKKQIICKGCGAVVGDTELHDKFHEGLARVASQASSADMWTRPIGSTDFGDRM